MKDKLAAFLGAALASQQLRPTPLPSEARNPPAFQPRPSPGKPSVQRRPMSAPAIPSRLHRRKPIAHTQKQSCHSRHRPDVFNMRSEHPAQSHPNSIGESPSLVHRNSPAPTAIGRMFSICALSAPAIPSKLHRRKPIDRALKQSCHRPDVFNMRSERPRNPIPTPSAKAHCPCAE